jgi:hypothetical protein
VLLKRETGGVLICQTVSVALDSLPDQECSKSNGEVFMQPRAAVFSVIIALALLAAPVPSLGQQPGKVHRIGFQWGSMFAPTEDTPPKCPITGSPNWQAWVEGLREHGYIPGQDLVIECRWDGGRNERADPRGCDLGSVAS